MQSMCSRGMLLGGMVLVGALSTGCGVAIEGEEGNLRFEYENSALSGAFSEDIAVGAMVDVKVRETADSDFLPIESASSSAEDVISVSETSGDVFSLLAEQEGVARISVSATSPDGSLSDSVELRTATVERIEFDQICGQDSVYAVNSPLEFQYRMFDSMDSSLNGYGYYPVAVEPVAGGEVNEAFTKLGRLQVMSGADAGSYSLTSELAEEPLEFQLISPAEVTELDVSSQVDGEVISTVASGEDAQIAVFAMAGPAGETVCGPAQGVFDMVSETPEVCEVFYTYGVGLHVVNVEGLSAGDCEITLSVPDTELSETLLVEISE